MPSSEAAVLNFVLKYLTKPLQAPMPITPGVMRGLRLAIEIGRRLAFRTPPHITLEPASPPGPAGEWVISDQVTDHRHVLLYLHGGGYFFGSPATHRPLTWRLSHYSQTRVFSLDYRLVPEHTVDDCRQDALDAYRWLLQNGVAPEHLFIGGDSAGGGLTLLTLLALKQQHLPLPRAAICLSPFADMSQTSPSLVTNRRASHMFHANALKRMEAYLTQHRDPYDPDLSPLFGDYTDLPPLFLQAANTELLFHDALRVVQKARSQGVEVELDLWSDLPHVFTIFADLIPEGKQGIRNIAAFMANMK